MAILVATMISSKEVIRFNVREEFVLEERMLNKQSFQYVPAAGYTHQQLVVAFNQYAVKQSLPAIPRVLVRCIRGEVSAVCLDTTLASFRYDEHLVYLPLSSDVDLYEIDVLWRDGSFASSFKGYVHVYSTAAPVSMHKYMTVVAFNTTDFDLHVSEPTSMIIQMCAAKEFSVSLARDGKQLFERSASERYHRVELQAAGTYTMRIGSEGGVYKVYATDSGMPALEPAAAAQVGSEVEWSNEHQRSYSSGFNVKSSLIYSDDPFVGMFVCQCSFDPAILHFRGTYRHAIAFSNLSTDTQRAAVDQGYPQLVVKDYLYDRGNALSGAFRYQTRCIALDLKQPAAQLRFLAGLAAVVVFVVLLCLCSSGRKQKPAEDLEDSEMVRIKQG